MGRLLVTIAFMLASAASLFTSFTVAKSAFLGFLLYYVVCCLGLPALDLLAFRKVAPRNLGLALGLSAPSRKDLALGFGSGIAMALITLACLLIFKERIFGDGSVQSALKGWGASGRNLAFVYAVMLVFNGAVEELFWRGYIHERLEVISKRPLALGLPVFFFAAQHVFVISRLVADPGLVALMLIGILGAGAIWGFMRERTGKVLPCVISHMLVTAGYMGALLLFGS